MWFQNYAISSLIVVRIGRIIILRVILGRELLTALHFGQQPNYWKPALNCEGISKEKHSLYPENRLP